MPRDINVQDLYGPARVLPVWRQSPRTKKYEHALDIRKFSFKKNPRFKPYATNETMRRYVWEAERLLLDDSPLGCRRDAWDALPQRVESDIANYARSVNHRFLWESDERIFGSYLAKLFEELRKEPYNYHLHEQIACLLQSVTHSQRYQPARVREVMYLFGSGVYGVVASGEFRAPYPPHEELRKAVTSPSKTPFVIKAETTPDNPRVGYASMNEAFIGLFALNPLKRLIPNFAYVYGTFTAPAPESKYDNEKREYGDVKLFARPGIARYNMIQFVPDAKTYYDWYDEYYKHEDFPRWTQEIYSQICLALAVAQERCDFSHNDLHGSNVLISRLTRRSTIEYPRIGRGSIFLETDWLVTIIDYGYAHATVQVDRRVAENVIALTPPGLPHTAELVRVYGQGSERGYFLSVGMWSNDECLSALYSNALGDILRISGVSYSLLGTHLRAWGRALVGGETPVSQFFSDFKKETRYLAGVTINLFDFYAAGLNEALSQNLGLRVAIKKCPDDFAPLLSCKISRCVSEPFLAEYVDPPRLDAPNEMAL